MTLGHGIIIDWAKNNKAEVCETAQRYSGSFMISLTQTFSRADGINADKILDTWYDEFRMLYQLSKGGKP